MLTHEFVAAQVAQIDAMLLETRQAIERGMQVEEQLLAQRDKWLGRVASDKFEPFLIGLPSLYIPEQRDGDNGAA